MKKTFLFVLSFLFLTSLVWGQISPGVGDLLITEVCGDGADGSDNDNGFMEIYNTTSNALNLNNVRVRYYTYPSGPASISTFDLFGSMCPYCNQTAKDLPTCHQIEILQITKLASVLDHM